MEAIVRTMLKRGVRGKSAHLDPTAVLDGLDYRFTGLYPTAIPNTIWQIAQHIHLWVYLKVELFEGREIVMPEGHGFSTETFPPSEEAWEKFKLDFKAAIIRIEELTDSLDLVKKYPIWNDYTAAEMIEVMITHNSYHAAQIVAMRRVLGVWNR